MRIQPLSFLLGLAAAALAPTLSRLLWPLAVEAAAAGMGAVEEGRRLFAQQVELIEDLAAEARARREHLLRTQGSTNGDGSGMAAEVAAAVPRRRRRTSARTSTPGA